MKTEEPSNTYAVYDDRDGKLRGGFTTEQEGAEWLVDNLPFEVYDTEGNHIMRVATAFEADLIIRRGGEGLCWERARPRDFEVLLELI